MKSMRAALPFTGLVSAFLSLFLLWPYWTSHVQASDPSKVARNDGAHQAERRSNRLIREKSPYLLQHAYNPVDWFPWGEDAFDKARKEDKPILLSIGYSTCHWCHVMERESFEDQEVARLMNEVFVAIKVDREERPDIDHTYMIVAQMISGGGGWPLTVIMTPDKTPFFAGTYFPKKSRFGRIGMVELSQRIQHLWTTQREAVLQSAKEVAAGLRQLPQDSPGQAPGKELLENAYQQLSQRFDQKRGGFGQAPKFPTPHNMLFLLRHWKRTGDGKALEMVENTLQAMRLGGIYDHVGFGFHRYSTDAKWLVPHFEKMLYDQAMLAMAYVEVYQATRKEEYGKTAREILTYVLRDMTDPTGGFYSAEDADSEGQEGKFYLWTTDQIRQVLEPKEAELVIHVFGVDSSGNFEDEASGRRSGANILLLKKPLTLIASELKISEGELANRLEKARQKLFASREKRIHPHKDDKILTDWNGLMIAALSKASQVFGQPEYSQAAQKSADFILNTVRGPGGRLLHRYRDGDSALPANVDDYAFLIWGLIDLYEATFEVRYLNHALELNDQLLARFWDKKSGGLYFTAEDGEALLLRRKEIYDGAIPSGNSAAALNFLRLARLTGRTDLEQKTEQIGRTFSGNIRQLASAHTLFLSALDFGIGPSYEVVITGNPKGDDTKIMLRDLRGAFLPNKVVLFRPSGTGSSEIAAIAPYARHQESIQGKATAYVCQAYNCTLPTTDSTKMLERLGAKQP